MSYCNFESFIVNHINFNKTVSRNEIFIFSPNFCNPAQSCALQFKYQFSNRKSLLVLSTVSNLNHTFYGCKHIWFNAVSTFHAVIEPSVLTSHNDHIQRRHNWWTLCFSSPRTYSFNIGTVLGLSVVHLQGPGIL